MKTIQSYVKNLTFIILINFIIYLFETQSLRIVLSLKNCLDKIPYIQEHLNLLITLHRRIKFMMNSCFLGVPQKFFKLLENPNYSSIVIESESQFIICKSPQILLSENDHLMTQHFKPSLLNISKSLFLLTHFTVC